MITLNGKEVKITRFPDNSIKFDIDGEIHKDKNKLVWKFESMEELFTLIGLMSKSLKNTDVDLYLPYLPNARMDKIQNANEGLMLKYFVETVDNLGFNRITILDPHSEVYKDWVRNTEWFSNDELVKSLIQYTASAITFIESPEDMSSGEDPDFVTYVYPDEGALNRYTSLIGKSGLYGEKERCQSTGKILSFDIVGDIPESGPILIVDDICSRGGTFYFTAKKLREKGFTGNIYLYVTHTEQTIEEGELLNPDSEIKRIFTTNSILNQDIEKTTIYEL